MTVPFRRVPCIPERRAGIGEDKHPARSAYVEGE
jgi:hypothetical protein